MAKKKKQTKKAATPPYYTITARKRKQATRYALTFPGCKEFIEEIFPSIKEEFKIQCCEFRIVRENPKLPMLWSQRFIDEEINNKLKEDPGNEAAPPDR